MGIPSQDNKQPPRFGMAIWNPDSGNEGISINFHINYWRLSQVKGLGSKDRTFRNVFSENNKDTDCDYLDIGILINERIPNNICIYVPIKVENNDIIDLAEKFKDGQIASAIFNKSIDIHQTEKNDYIELIESNEPVNEDRRLNHFIHAFTKNGTPYKEIDTEALEVGDGTKLTIHINDLMNAGLNTRSSDESKSHYLRFRIKIRKPGESPFFKSISPPDFFFHSGTENTEYIDFRLNNARHLPDEIRKERSRCENNMNLSRVDFFLAAAMEADIIDSTANKQRLLEPNLWGEYLSLRLRHAMLIYHWKSSQPNAVDFSVFAKLRIRKSGLTRILIYIILGFILAMIANILSAYVIQTLVTLTGQSTKEPIILENTKERETK